jgi:dTDP-glucose 4,6-dehydratase
MRVLITGGAGFIGSHLCDAYIEAGHDVICVDNLLTGRRENVQGLIGRPGFSFRPHNISEPLFVDGVIDQVLHFASPASPVDYLAHPIATLKVGSLGTHHALGVARAKNARFILASTSEVYGDPEIHPQREDYWGNVNPVGPRGCYDEAKRFAEAITMAYHRAHGMNTGIVRIFNTYGPRMRLNDGRVLPALMCQALKNEPMTIFGDGSQTRSFCFVDDLVRGIMLLAASDEHDPVNIGNPAEITIREFADEIQSMVPDHTAGIELKPLPQDDPRKRRPDITRAREILCWEPRVERRDGLAVTLDYFKSELGLA